MLPYVVLSIHSIFIHREKKHLVLSLCFTIVIRSTTCQNGKMVGTCIIICGIPNKTLNSNCNLLKLCNVSTVFAFNAAWTSRCFIHCNIYCFYQGLLPRTHARLIKLLPTHQQTKGILVNSCNAESPLVQITISKILKTLTEIYQIEYQYVRVPVIFQNFLLCPNSPPAAKGLNLGQGHNL